jgi:hypothetical protein
MRRVCVAVLVLLSAACTAHRALRPVAEGIPTSIADIQSDPAHRAAVAARSLEQHRGGPEPFDLAVIEMDDQGWLWNPRQLRLAIETAEAAAGSSGALIVVFFHGWKNNADVCNLNLACFRQALAELASWAQHTRPPGEPARRVIGIYPAWRGLSITFPKNFSFWGRKETAHRVGRAAAADVVAEFDALQQRLPAGNRTRLVFIGHSFGAAVLYEASASVIRHSLVTATSTAAPSGCRPDRPEVRTIRSVGDLMVLVNPAFEASLYHDIDVRTHWFDRYSRLQTPVLMTVSSKGDLATRTFFPIGRWVSTLGQRTRGPDQRDALGQTIGNYEPFITHDLALLPDRQGTATGPRPACGCPVAFGKSKAVHEPPPAADPCQIHLGASREYGSLALTKRDGVSDDNPFAVVATDTSVITDHTGIFTAPFFEFLVRYVTAIDEKRRLIELRH